MYNRHPQMAIDHKINSLKESTQPVSPSSVTKHVIDKLIELRGQYKEKATNNIKKAQERQKKYYDAKHDSHHVSSIHNYMLLWEAQIQQIFINVRSTLV